MSLVLGSLPRFPMMNGAGRNDQRKLHFGAGRNLINMATKTNARVRAPKKCVRVCLRDHVHVLFMSMYMHAHGS